MHLKLCLLKIRRRRPPLPHSFPPGFVTLVRPWIKKRAALNCYGSEMASFPHPRSKEAVIAPLRLRSALAGLEVAEAFVTLRKIVG